MMVEDICETKSMDKRKDAVYKHNMTEDRIRDEQKLTRDKQVEYTIYEQKTGAEGSTTCEQTGTNGSLTKH